MINKEYTWKYTGIFIVCAVLLIIGAFYDWQITNALYAPHTTWAIVLETVGSLPRNAALPLIGALLIFAQVKYKLLSRLFGSVLLIVSSMLLVIVAAKELEERGILITDKLYLICALGGILIAAVIYLIIKRQSNNTKEKLFVISKFFVVYFIVEVVVTSILKTIFGRGRYDEIILGNGFFSPWYSPDFLGGGTSFPSGHVMGACGILVLLLVPYIFESQKKYKNIWFIIPIAYIGFVALSRLIMGRHFLSDVTMAMALMTVIFIVLVHVFEKKGWFKTGTIFAVTRN